MIFIHLFAVNIYDSIQVSYSEIFFSPENTHRRKISVHALEIYFIPSKKKRGSSYVELKSKGEQSLRTISGTEFK